jgi:hypothetical protein
MSLVVADKSLATLCLFREFEPMMKFSCLAKHVSALFIACSTLVDCSTAQEPIFGATFDNNTIAGIAGGNATPVVAGDVTINNSSKFGAGSLDSTEVFSGGNGLRYETAGNFNPLAGTIDFWIRMPNGFNETRQDLFSIFAGGYTGDFSLYIDPVSLRLQTVVDVAGNNQWTQPGYANAFADLGDGNWHHIAWEWDTQAETPYATLYFDGVVENYNTFGTVSFNGGALGAQMEIGSRQGGYDAFQGLIDDFRIFDTAIYGQAAFTPPTQSTIPDSPVGTAGDFDDDGDVDGRDFLLWQRGFGSEYDANDLADWQTNYGFPSQPLVSVTTVPEPSAALLLFVLAAAPISFRSAARGEA